MLFTEFRTPGRRRFSGWYSPPPRATRVMRVRIDDESDQGDALSVRRNVGRKSHDGNTAKRRELERLDTQQHSTYVEWRPGRFKSLPVLKETMTVPVIAAGLLAGKGGRLHSATEGHCRHVRDVQGQKIVAMLSLGDVVYWISTP